MAIIPQISFDVWDDDNELGDLERLRLVIEHMPDEELMRQLEKERYKGRDKYPVRVVWNTILAGVVFDHSSMEDLIRELRRNPQLRKMCGVKGINNVPPSWVYSRFFKKLFNHEEEINKMFDSLVEEAAALLPDFGKRLAIDSKAISSLAKHKNSNDKEDGRRDTDADYGRKEYHGVREDGTRWQKIVKWFGYKLHLIVDSTYELPVVFEVTRASVSDVKEGHKLIETLDQKHHETIIDKCEVLTADKGYDDIKLIKKLWDEYNIKPVIDIRNMWKDGEESRQLRDYENVAYNYKGDVYCYCMKSGKRREMVNGGFERDRGTLKKLCPARQYGLKCEYMEDCPVKQGIRISLEEDRRIFTPIARSSYKWKKEYDKRTSAERVNSRIDVSFGFEKHYIRGQKKMSARCGLALCVMLVMAVGRIKEGQMDKMRSLVKSA
jgi:hypothetical protein